jgi:hypothetical protein
MPIVYIETSIVSYLRQRPSGQIVAAARQLITQRWWDHERNKYQSGSRHLYARRNGRGGRI